MVKKVLDIIPPQREDKREETVSEQAKIVETEPEPKPKITYIAKTETARPAVKPKRERKYSPLFSFLFKSAFVAALLVASFLFFDYKLAKAAITIKPQTESLKSEAQLIVDSSVKTGDFAKKVIPGTIITAEKTFSDDFQSSGKKNSQNKALGTVKIYNNFSAPQRLIQGTRLQAPLEKFQPALTKDETPWFRTQADITIPAKSSADVQVVSDGIGGKFNIEPSIFSVPGLVGTAQYTFIYGQSFAKFKGGEKSDLPEIKQEDLDNAKAELTKKADTEIKKELEVMVPQGFEMIEETAKVEVLDAAPAASTGANVEKFTYQIKVRATVMIFNRADLDNFGKELIQSQVPDGQKIYDQSYKSEFSYLPASAPSSSAAGLAAQSAVVKIVPEAETYAPINEEDLKKGLAGRKASEAKFFLMNQPKVKDVGIEVSPFWRTVVPKDLDKIKINLIFE
jgi:hypothetical protein